MRQANIAPDFAMVTVPQTEVDVDTEYFEKRLVFDSPNQPPEGHCPRRQGISNYA